MVDNDDDMEYMIRVLENKKNSHILNKSHNDIKSEKNDILQKIGIHGSGLKKMHKLLYSYAYIKNIHQLHEGCFIRWINLKKSLIQLYDNHNDTNNIMKVESGGIICSIQKDRYKRSFGLVTLKSQTRFFSIYFDDCVVFQKFTQQEELLMYVMKYLK